MTNKDRLCQETTSQVGSVLLTSRKSEAKKKKKNINVNQTLGAVQTKRQLHLH